MRAWPLALLLTLLLAAPVLRAQNTEEDEVPALLVADTVVVTPDNELVAEGNVEVRYEGRTLQASRVIYDQASDRITLEGPLRVVEADGTILTAESAEVDAGFEDGLLRGARLVLDQQLQMAAVQIARAEGRYSQLSRGAVTSCRICGETGAPLWEIRARRIIHDDVEKQIYLEGAQLRVGDIPILYVPYLRLPDPTLERARGFLFPTYRTTTQLGFGVKVPYFIPLGPHRDITLTPYVSAETVTLEARYRQAFVSGNIEVNAALTRDSLIPDETRGYLFAEGRFSLPRDFRLRFDIELSTDEGYLKEYGYANKSRLDSAIAVFRTDRDRLTYAEFTHFNTLRDNENNATQPAFLLDAAHEQRLYPRLGGEVRMRAAAHGHFRYSEDDVIGRDVFRSHASALWRETWASPGGLLFAAQTGFNIDAVRNSGDSTVPDEDATIAPHALVSLRFPLVATDPAGTRHALEPLAQLSWTGGDRLETGNDESQRSEFDEGNLLSLSRFPADDRRERGWQAAAGLRWSMIASSGLRAGLTVGRVVREETRSSFSETSGLSEATSDWLLASHVGTANGLDLIARTLIDDEGSINRAEARGVWSNNTVDLGASYLLLPEDAREDRDDLISEWSFDASYRLSRHWTASGNWQYDLSQDRSANGGLGLEYQNECVVVRFEADRDFADSDNLDPTTTFELTVELKGFSTGGDAGGFRRTCSN